jgi:DNA-nicking Smr family endonuclease
MAMDFGKILDEWEKRKESHIPMRDDSESDALSTPNDPPEVTKPDENANRELLRWLTIHGVQDKDDNNHKAETEIDNKKNRIAKTRRIIAMAPETSLDLHGLTVKEATIAVLTFLRSSAAAGREKVLIVHGKGIHSKADHVLSDLVKRLLESEPLAGAFGPASQKQGGKGATWVRIRKNK